MPSGRSLFGFTDRQGLLGPAALAPTITAKVRLVIGLSKTTLRSGRWNTGSVDLLEEGYRAGSCLDAGADMCADAVRTFPPRPSTSLVYFLYYQIHGIYILGRNTSQNESNCSCSFSTINTVIEKKASKMVLQQVTTPPGQVTPYVISAYDGETLQLPGTKSVIRILASAKETNGAFSVFRMDGVAGEPVGFHYHNEAHDIFMCARGQLEVWAGDKARLLNAGDFAYVPPVSHLIHRF